MTHHDIEWLNHLRSRRLRDVRSLTLDEVEHLLKLVTDWDMIHIDEAEEVLARLDRGDAPFERVSA